MDFQEIRYMCRIKKIPHRAVQRGDFMLGECNYCSKLKMQIKAAQRNYYK